MINVKIKYTKLIAINNSNKSGCYGVTSHTYTCDSFLCYTFYTFRRGQFVQQWHDHQPPNYTSLQHLEKYFYNPAFPMPMEFLSIQDKTLLPLLTTTTTNMIQAS